MNLLHEKMKSALSEQDLNLLHLSHALGKLGPYLPVMPEHLDDKDVVEHIDQLILRFMKTKDGIGRRLIPLIVEVIESDTAEMTFIDKLNRLEKFGLIECDEWNLYRKLRNDLTHTYPEEKEELVAAINEAINVVPKLETTYRKMKSFCQAKILSPGTENG